MAVTKSSLPFVISEGLLLAGLTFLGYLATFIFQASYLSYFNLPIELMSINLKSVLISTTIIFVVFAVILNFIDPFYKEIFKPESILKRRLGVLFILVFYTITRAIFYDSISEVKIPLVITGVFAFLYFIMPLIFHRDKTTFIKKLEADAERLTRNDENSIISRLFDLPFARLIFGVVFTLVVLSIDFGRAQAVTKHSYPVFNYNDRKMAVVTINEDKLIALTFDEENKKLFNEYTIISFDDVSQKELLIKTIKTGKLTVER